MLILIMVMELESCDNIDREFNDVIILKTMKT